MIVVVVASLGPGMADQISKTMPINKTGAFANAASSADVWTSGFNIVSVVLIVFISVPIRALKGIQGGNGGDQ